MRHSPCSIVLSLTSLWLLGPACDSDAELQRAGTVAAAEQNAAFELESKVERVIEPVRDVEIEPAHFDLEAVAGLVGGAKLESAAALELALNDAAGGYSELDIDDDDEVDHVQVVEIKGPRVAAAPELELDAEDGLETDVVLELRAVPSSSHSVEAAVAFATLSFARHPVNSEVEIRTGFTTVVREPDVREYTRVVPVEIDSEVLVGGSAFLASLYAEERPAFVGAYEVDERGQWIPPDDALGRSQSKRKHE